MKKLFLLILCLSLYVYVLAQNKIDRSFNLSFYNPIADGITDDTPAFQKLFFDVERSNGGTITIPPGRYYLKGDIPLSICSNTIIYAYGATFFLPKNIEDKSRIILFQGTDISDFSWFGGSFKGYCFDPDLSGNTWEPNVNTRILVINTSNKGTTNSLNFKDICSDRIAGAVVNVNGYSDEDEPLNNNFATNVSVENCTLINSGKFMWDYGFLWQTIVFNESYTQSEIDMAHKYFDRSLIISNVKIEDKSKYVFLKNRNPESNNDPIIKNGQDICFYNDKLPENLIQGKRYYVVKSTSQHIEISDSIGGKSIVFKGSGGTNIKIIKNVTNAFFQYAPIESGPGKGCIDLVDCKNTKITGCRISALGDAMHIYHCYNNVFSNNHILGARMGAFFLANNCKNSTIIGNTVDGTNGSRVISIERSNENVTMIGNIFRGGGRGSWINQPKNIIIQGNIFINNTLKGTQDSKIGRRDYITGKWQAFPELYFTTYEKDSVYGPVILKDNIFITGNEAKAAIQFEKNGKDIQVSGNIFKGSNREIWMDEEDRTIIIENNPGMKIMKGNQYSKPMFRNRL